MKIFPDDYIVASDDEIKEAKEKGERHIVKDNEVELTVYLYKNKIYVDDINN